MSTQAEQAAAQAAIDAILARGRETRRALPRGVWLAAAVIGVLCAVGFAIALVSDSPPARPAVAQPAVPRALERSFADGTGSSAPRGVDDGAGFLAGLAIGGAAGLALGAALARHRRDHSSRSRP